MFNPKWLLFLIITFGLIHVVSYIAPTGELAAPPGADMGSFWGVANTIKTICFFDYDYLDGAGFILKFILSAFQGVFIFLALKEILDYGRGR